MKVSGLVHASTNSRPTLSSLMVLVVAVKVTGAAAAPTKSDANSEGGATLGVRPEVAIEAHDAGSEALPLLRAELSELGLDIVEQASSTTIDVFDDAQFKIVVRHSSLEVWVVDRSTREVTFREVFAHTDGSPVEVRTAVIHAVELLRWQLRDREARLGSPATVAVSTSLPTKVRPDTRLRQPSWFVGFSPLALHSPGGTRPGAGFMLDVTWQPEHFGLRLTGGMLLLPATLTQPEGSAEVTPRFLGLEGLVSNQRPSKWSWEVAAGVDVISVRLRGRSDLPLRTHEDGYATVAPSLSIRPRYDVRESISLVANASMMIPLRSDAMYMNDREVGHYGRLLFVAGLGLRASIR